MILSVQYTLSFITSCFEEMFSKSRNFYENNLILWFRSGQKWPGKCMARGLMNTIPRIKTKKITITKNKSLLFFSVQCIIAKTM